jgi:predicted dehydrogenase/NADPH:quinone reductase-like Zn-dependent oxidoreductase
VKRRVADLAVSGLNAVLEALGHEGQEVPAARRELVDWTRARVRAVRRRRGVVRGSAVVITARGRAELRPVERVVAGPGELTVEVLATVISPGTERAQWLRLPNAQPQIPYMPGYSAAGRVLAVGRGVDAAAGDRVAIARAPHASVATVPFGWTTPVPDGVALPEAALVYLAMIAGYGARRASMAAGDRLCVVGAGPIGLLAQRLATMSDPAEVTVVARTGRHEEAAREGGADQFRTSAAGVDDVEADVVIEATGDPAALGTAVAAARPGGRVVLLGSPRGRTPGEVLTAARIKGLTLVGAHISALATEAKRSPGDPFQELARTFVDGLADGSLRAADLAGPALDPREPQLTYRRLGRGEIDAGHFDWCLLPEGDRLTRSFLTAPPLRRAAMPRLPQSPPVAAEGRQVGGPRGGALRFVLVGCGDVGRYNARAIAAAAGAELVVSHDPVEGLAAAISEEFGGDVAGSLDQALDPDLVDAAFLCVPHDLHAPLVERAAAAGLQVVVEKPMANDLASARRAARAAEAAGVTLSICFPFRYEPAMQAARDLVARGVLGDPHGVTVSFHADKPEGYWFGGFSGRSQSGWRASATRSGGGVLIMNLTHYLDFIRYVAGLDAISVAATTRIGPGAEVEDFVSITAVLEGGAIASISGSASTRGAPPSRFELWGELGTLRLEPEPALYTETALGGLNTGAWTALPGGADVDPRRVYVERFAAAVREGRPAEVSAADGLAVQAFVEAAYQSAEQGGIPVDVPSYASADA